MPKETAHMVLAQQVRRHLPKDSVFYRPVRRFFNLFLYGSVAPDSCFYYVAGPQSARVQNAGEIFHKPDSRSLMPILRLLETFGPKDDVLAFAAGLGCHIITDTQFHPMVYYFAGLDNFHEGATTRHRMLETALDLHIRTRTRQDEALFLHLVLDNLEVPDTRAARFLKTLFCQGDELLGKRMRYALKCHGLAHRLFSNFNVFKWISVFSRLGLNIPQQYEALFYPFDHPVRLGFFEQIPDYLDPVTGVPGPGTVDELIQRVVTKSLQLLLVMGESVTKGRSRELILADPALPEIRPCPPLDAQLFRYWRGNCDLKQQVYNHITV